ncbi:hypothetical protein [Dyella choica]|nr:hypothetical protein [Dyella choica]
MASHQARRYILIPLLQSQALFAMARASLLEVTHEASQLSVLSI